MATRATCATSAATTRSSTVSSRIGRLDAAGRVHEVRYEALVADQRVETGRLLAHCGLPWEEACLPFERNEHAVATASAVQVRQPLYASSVGRWRRFERHLQPLIDELRAAGVPVTD